MALIYGWRPSDNVAMSARYSTGGNRSILSQSSFGGRIVDAGAIGGFTLDLSSLSIANAVVFPGKNFSSTGAFSFGFRIKPNYTGSPSGVRGLCTIVTQLMGNLGGPVISIVHQTSGQVQVFARGLTGVMLSNVNLGAWSPTSGIYYDHVLTWNQSATASSFKYYINATLIGSGSPSVSWAGIDNARIISFGLGGNATTNVCASSFEELFIFDTVIDPTVNVDLESGAGLLNGASRTSFVSDVAGSPLTEFDGLSATDPGAGNVLVSAGNYKIDGVTKTPTYVAASAANVKIGVTFGAASAETGIYDGSDRWTDPGEPNVANGVAYKANSTFNNKTGTLQSITNTTSRGTGVVNTKRLTGVLR